ncbi:5119_t:CDS:2 [Acaulospora morrowiae]|uniref:5119_t:CDS:1 n=1 Tax=Acaulospora morrowiae TaxID=94023 RepID=A0A9N9BJA4_9GLOM|nr:5119_t:CDS:2 [Acaulospora morrowiae]
MAIASFLIFVSLDQQQLLFDIVGSDKDKFCIKHKQPEMIDI